MARLPQPATPPKAPLGVELAKAVPSFLSRENTEDFRFDAVRSLSQCFFLRCRDVDGVVLVPTVRQFLGQELQSPPLLTH